MRRVTRHHFGQQGGNGTTVWFVHGRSINRKVGAAERLGSIRLLVS
jgi:hypothetical protein